MTLPGSRALACVSRWFDPAIVHRTFEPLIADWQRELAATTSLSGRARVFVSGSSAMVIAILTCLLEGGVAMPRQAIVKGIAILIVSTLALLAIQIGIMTASYASNIPLEMRFWFMLPVALPLAIPFAMLAFMMVIRALGTVRTGSAAVTVCAGAVAAYLITAVLTPMLQTDVRDELYEQSYLQTVADDRAGVVTYPGTARRQARPTTPEQRAAERAKWRQSAYYLEYQAERTRPRWGRGSMMIAALTLAMGGLGWAIGGLGRTSVMGAAAWWVLAWIVMMLDGRFVVNQGTRLSAIMPRPPFWLPLAIFASAALILLLLELTRAKENSNRRMETS